MIEAGPSDFELDKTCTFNAMLTSLISTKHLNIVCVTTQLSSIRTSSQSKSHNVDSRFSVG